MTQQFVRAMLFAAALALAPNAATADGADQLRRLVENQLSPLDPDVDVGALSDSEVVQLSFAINQGLKYRERRAAIRSVLLRKERREAATALE